MPKLETARLILRDFAEDDLDAFAALAANPGFMNFSGSGALTREQAAALLEKISSRTRAGLPAQFALILRDNHCLIGYCGFFLQNVDGVDELEIGYRLHPDYWNRGLATEAARAVRDHAFNDLRIDRVISLIHPDNHASQRVAEKNGMTLGKKTVFRTFPTLVFTAARTSSADDSVAPRLDAPSADVGA